MTMTVTVTVTVTMSMTVLVTVNSKPFRKDTSVSLFYTEFHAEILTLSSSLIAQTQLVQRQT